MLHGKLCLQCSDGIALGYERVIQRFGFLHTEALLLQVSHGKGPAYAWTQVQQSAPPLLVLDAALAAQVHLANSRMR